MTLKEWKWLYTKKADISQGKNNVGIGLTIVKILSVILKNVYCVSDPKAISN